MTDDLVMRLDMASVTTHPMTLVIVIREAAAFIEAQDKRNKELEAALRKIESKHWYPTTAEIAREALGEKKDDASA